MIHDLREELRKSGGTLVVANGEVRTFYDRGIAALYRLLMSNHDFLKGAMVADKVVGKGAAALMRTGGIAAVYAEVISEPALALLTAAPGSIKVEYGTIVPQISNRSHTGLCPLEQLCLQAHTAEECLPLIKSFMEGVNGEIILRHT